MATVKHFIAILITLFTASIYAQVEFNAEVSKNKLGINERLRIDFEMNVDGDNFNPPSFTNFDVVGGPSQSTSVSYVNGVKSFSKVYSYFLQPNKQGKFSIEQATVEFDGKTYKTTTIPVTVTAAVAESARPGSPKSVADNKIHLVAEVSKSNPYLNEALTVVYKLYVSPDVAVNDWQYISEPKFRDFWSQTLDVSRRVQKGTYKGENYRFLILRKTVLYPQKTGKLELEPLALKIFAEVPTNKRNIFGSIITSRANTTVTAGSRTINVKPLPITGKPEGFSGAVGEFDFKVTTTKNALNATESLQAKIEVSGKGNLKLFSLPKLETPSALEVFEPEHNENVRTSLGGMRGSIADSYTIVPQYKGKYPIPSVDFSYFDLKTERYKTLTSEELLIDVLEGPSSTTDPAVASSSNTAKQPVVAQEGQFNFIKTKPNLIPINSDPFFNSPLFWSLLFGPLLAIPLTIIVSRKRAERAADVVGNKRRRADRLARKYLSEAKKALGNKDEFYVALEKALHNYLKAKLRIETSELSKPRIEELMIERGVDTEPISDFKALLASSEQARYSPFTAVTMQQDYNKASETISLIDKQIG